MARINETMVVSMAIESRQFVKFKDNRFLNHLPYLHPKIAMVMFDMADWCYIRNIPFVLTDVISTERRDRKLGRVSDAHRTKRAFDLRSHTFPPGMKANFIYTFNRKYKDKT